MWGWIIIITVSGIVMYYTGKKSFLWSPFKKDAYEFDSKIHADTAASKVNGEVVSATFEEE